jgi:hypothetical protein
VFDAIVNKKIRDGFVMAVTPNAPNMPNTGMLSFVSPGVLIFLARNLRAVYCSSVFMRSLDFHSRDGNPAANIERKAGTWVIQDTQRLLGNMQHSSWRPMPEHDCLYELYRDLEPDEPVTALCNYCDRVKCVCSKSDGDE